MLRSILAYAIAGLLSVSAPIFLHAQELRVHPTPFSVWLDFEKLSKPYPPQVALPIWMESVVSQPLPRKPDEPERTAFRIRLRRMPSLHSEVQLRIFFEDRAGAAPVVTTWTETGTMLHQSAPLGNGLNLPSSATLEIPVDGADYIDVSVDGDGRNVRGVFAASLRKVEAKAAIDFSQTSPTPEPFGAAPAAKPEKDDLYLYGRVRAALEDGPVKLEPGTGVDAVTWDVQLDAPPLGALITFEVLGADIAMAPELAVNALPLGQVNMTLPDLADPGYRGDIRPLEKDVRFQYTGWLKCQRYVPGSAFNSGLNRVRLRLSSGSGPVAIRAVEVQLKHHWQDFDYKVTP